MYSTRVTRRSVLGGAAVVATTAAVGAATGSLGRLPGSSKPTRIPATPPNLSRLRQRDFEQLIGSAFIVRVGSDPRSVLLKSVTPFAAKKAPKHAVGKTQTVPKEQFSLMFSGSKSDLFPQATYTLSSTQLGTFDMFLVPVGQATSEQHYQAIIINV
jgi:hypothetical protein